MVTSPLVPANVLACDLGLMVRAISITLSIVMLPLWRTKDKEMKVKAKVKRIFAYINMQNQNNALILTWQISFHHHILFFCFFLSLGGSFNALMIRAAAVGTTSTLAWRFCTVSLTVTLNPFQSPVALAISSPTFLGDYEETMITYERY